VKKQKFRNNHGEQHVLTIRKPRVNITKWFITAAVSLYS